MRIPEVRKELGKMVVQLSTLANHYSDLEISGMATRLLQLIIELKRRPAIKRARQKARPLTPALKAKIKAFGIAHPEMLNRDIGDHFGVDGGRVTDSMRGKRT